MPDRWEIFSGLGLAPEPGTTYATTGFAYPTSHQLLHLNAAKERKRLRDQEERDSPLYKEKTSKVIHINGEDVTDEYNAGNKVHARVLETRERAFHKSQSICTVNEKYSMLRTGSRVTLVKSEVEENEAGEKVNKHFDFEYPLPNFYFEDNLEEYIEGLRHRFTRLDPEKEMGRVKNKTVEEYAASLGIVGCIYGEQATFLTVASTLSYITRLVRTLEKHVVRCQGELDH